MFMLYIQQQKYVSLQLIYYYTFIYCIYNLIQTSYLYKLDSTIALLNIVILLIICDLICNSYHFCQNICDQIYKKGPLLKYFKNRGFYIMLYHKLYVYKIVF